VPFVNDARLYVETGMSGATGNIYTGLHEFNDMGFLLHYLRKEDLFVDVGANIGSYTILASKCSGARCISAEPIERTFEHLRRNVELNGVAQLVTPLNVGVASQEGKLNFSNDSDTTNRVVPGGADSSPVRVHKLDSLVCEPVNMMKIDVEGFESEVLAGASGHLSSESLTALIVELNGSGSAYGFDDLEVHRSLLQHGFTATGYDPLSRNLVELNAPGPHNTLYLRNLDTVRKRVRSSNPFMIWGHAV